MRKLILAAIAAGTLSIVAIASAAAHDDHSTGQWPTSCVDLNDIVEEHLGRLGNVGIYQRTFGDQAEAACRNDHRNDVRLVFAWAIGDTPAPPASNPAPTSSSASQLWVYEADTDPISQKAQHYAHIDSPDYSSRIYVRCELDQDEPLDLYVVFYDEHISGNYGNQVEVEYRFAGSSPVAENWHESGSNESVFAPDDVKVAFARQLISASSLVFRATDYYDLASFLAEFTLDGQSDPHHPVRRVLQACGISV